ncbi:lactate utilization protein C [Oceanobacter sp. 3_MG-2023]|jgi:L-lactate dehydrogenase complex protein LldG|uniref:LutC/YkgG family protein n=1 Tax=Oceanobacter sp. 3_MG-2023 TaxID=3062622 RepID=UPI0027340FA3|nr:lactate utilization protein C [Oceanobacter sp. 3_MG-2023]MDP2506193.1 lactate utilization protein C [Oceanobacter sp. 3_MG-2023]
MSSRNTILARLRQGQANQASAASRTDLPPMPRLDKAVWRSRFIELLESNHADVVPCSEDDWQQQLAEVLQQQQVTSLCLGNSPANRELADELTSRVATLSVQLFDDAVAAPADSGMRQQLFEQLDAGFSRASAALAETGSLVLATGPEEPRTVSLVPPLSLVLVRQSTLVANFSALIEQPRWQGKLPTNWLLISGPSKTADIQQTLAYGAHGPKQLVVLLLDDSTGA